MTRQNTYKILQERGYIYQCTDEPGLIELFDKEMVTGYIGFDITADSLHVGHLLPLMTLGWMDRTGHRPIVLMGGGTSMIGDPSGRTEHRKVITRETIMEHMKSIRVQAQRFVDLERGRAMMQDNSDWLMNLNFVNFVRDIGVHFSVNRMLTMDCYKNRLEAGLTFFEFSYMLLQSYDFLHMYKADNNKLQLGGQDQWGNIVAGVDLIRRDCGGSAFGATMPLLLDPRTGEKFGKTNAGAVWLDKNKTSVYDFYQFWRNTDDQAVTKLLYLFTYLPTEEVRQLEAQADKNINRLKEILAYEITAFIHSHEEAAQAYLTSIRTFGAADPEGVIKTISQVAKLTAADAMADLPTVNVKLADLESASLSDLFVLAELVDSKSDARRLIRGGGAYIDETQVPVEDENAPVKGAAWLTKGEAVLRSGKKRYKKVLVG